jgi:hypothetical protein
MNKRQKKKAFKKRFGVNPPKRIKLHDAIIIFEHKDAILLAVERSKAIILDAWAQIKETFIKFYEELSKAFKEVAEKSRQQESEAMKIESSFNIRGHDRQKAGRTKPVI